MRYMLTENKSSSFSRIQTFLAIISLLCTITNFIYLSCLFLLTSLVLTLYVTQPYLRLSKLQSCIIILYLYFLLSTLLYDPNAFTHFAFYRRDGNFFITFAPLIIYGFIPIQLPVKKIFLYYLRWVTLANLIGLGLFFCDLLPNPTYSLFFHAHNAGGGFLCAIVGWCIATYMHSRSPLDLFMCIANAAGAYISQSRGSLLGLGVALIYVYVFKEKHTKKIVFGMVTGLTALLCLTYPIWIDYGMLETSHAIDFIDSDLFDRVGTVIDRGLFLWPRAIYLWLQSPIVGTGFGSYNDYPYNITQITHLLSWNFPEKYVYADSHAHHTFLHVLAETGVIGLGLLSWFLFHLHKYIVSIKDPILRPALLIIFWFNVWSSFTEHRLFTPSQMLPFTLLVGFLIGNQKFQEQQSSPSLYERSL